jgi:DNA-binding NarL/FixJ family response regulator
MEAPIQVLIMERQRLVAESLRHALQSLHPDLEVVGVAATRQEASMLAEKTRPQVVLVDSHLTDDVTAEFAHGLGRDGDAAIVMLGNDDGEETLLMAVEAEWRGYVDKQLPLETLVNVIRRTAAGEVVMPAELLYRAIQRQSLKKRNGNGVKVSQLTTREREVLELIGHGLDNKSIAAELGIRLTTTRSHVQRILEKLGVHSKLQAMRYTDRRARQGGPRRHRSAKLRGSEDEAASGH